MRKNYSSSKNYTCKKCDASFSHSGSLSNHQRVHDNQRPFVCDIMDCQKRFKSRVELKNHEKTHNEENPFKCDYKNCTKTFYKNDHLIKHQRTHTGETPYACDICGKAYRAKPALSYHIKVHNKPKKYKCEYDQCEEAFK